MKRILVVGGGLIGIRHVQAVVAHLRCELVGLADPDMTIAGEHMRFANMAEAPDNIDGAIIATPTHLHADHGIQATKRGWHVLIEKPVASTIKDAKRLENALKMTGTASLVGHHRRYHAPVQQLKSLIANGTIGTLVNASLIWAMRKPDAYFEGNWRTAGGSPVVINLVHDIDTLRFVVGEIVQTTALRGASSRGTDRIESGAVALMFENGATGTISFADTTPSPWGFEAGTGENPNIGTTHQDMMWITGTKGAVSFPSMTLWLGSDWGTSAKRTTLDVAQNTRTPLDAQLDHFINVMDGAPPLIDVADAARTLSVAQEIEAQLAQQTNAPTTRVAQAKFKNISRDIHMSKPAIGFIGLGLMGGAMVGRLQDLGYELTILGNQDRTYLDAAIARGAVEAKDAKAVAEASDIVMLCMGTSEHVEARMRGTNGVIAGLRVGATVIDFGTSLPGSTRSLADEVAAAGGTYLDAPLGRTPQHAVDGLLNIMAAGDKAAFDKVEGTLKDLGENVFHLGEIGSGHTIKLINNFFGMTVANAMAEAFAMADVAGVDRTELYKVMAAGPLHSGMMDFVKTYGVDKDPSAIAFAIKNAAKDVGYYAKMAEDAGVDSLMSKGTLTALTQARDSGQGEDMVGQMVDFYVKRFAK